MNIPTPIIDRGPETPAWALRLQVELDNTVAAIKTEIARLHTEVAQLKADHAALEQRVSDLETP